MFRRNTKQRQTILAIVRKRYDHPTAEQIYDEAHKIDPKISLGTVYRNLSVLSDENQIKTITLSDACHFDLRTDNHYHFVCEKCGKVYDLEVGYNNELDEKASKKGFIIKSHETVFKGLCPDCVNN